MQNHIILIQPVWPGSSDDEQLSVKCWTSDGEYELARVRVQSARFGSGTHFALSTDGIHFVYAAREGFAIVDLAAGEVVGSIGQQHSDVKRMLFSPNGRRCLTVSDQGISVWSIPDGRQITGIAVLATVGPVCFSWDAQLVAASLDKRAISLWHSSTGERLTSIDATQLHDIMSFSLSPNGASIAVSDYRDFFQLFEGDDVRSFFGHSGHVYSIEFSPDGQQIASCCSDGLVRIWATSGGVRQGPLPNHTNHVFAVKLSPKGSRFASGDYNGWRRTWDTETAVPLAEFNVNMGPDTQFCFLDENRLVSEEYIRSAEDDLRRVLVLRDVESGRILKEIGLFPGQGTHAQDESLGFRFESHGQETILRDQKTGHALAWFPEALHVLKHPSHDVFVGYGNWSVHVLGLETAG